MASTLRFVLKSLHTPIRIELARISPLLPVQSRFLYSNAALGLDNFVEHQKNVKNQMQNMGDKFRERMTEYTTQDSKNMIFTEDLKNMIFIAENEEDLELVVKMAKKFNSQNKELRFGNFIFGPVLMRMFYLHNKADLALASFKTPELEGIFDQLISYQILLDLLFENQQYEDMYEVFDVIKNKQLHIGKYPRNVVVLVMAACYKQNSEESVKFALELWSELLQSGHVPMRRAATFCAALALNYKKPEIALEILTQVRKSNYVTVRNLKAQALCQLGRLDDVIVILKSLLGEDHPGQFPPTLCREVLNDIKEAVAKLETISEIAIEFSNLEKILEKEGHITDKNLDAHLCSEIIQPVDRRPNNRQDFNNRVQFDSHPQKIGAYGRRRPRPGLAEIA